MLSSRAKGALISYLSLFFRNIAGIALIPVIISNVGVSHYGVYSIIMSVVGYLMIIELGLSNTSVRFISKALSENNISEANRCLGNILFLYGIAILIVLILSHFLYLQIPSIFSNSLTSPEVILLKDLFVYLVLNVVVMLIANSWTGVLIAHEHFVFIKTVDLLSLFVRTTLVIGLLLNGFGVTSILIVDLVLNFMVACLKLYAVFSRTEMRPQVQLEKALMKRILSYGFFIALGVIVNQVNWRFDIFLIGSLMNSSAVATFNIGLQFVLSFIALGAAISNVFLPKMVNITSKGYDSAIVMKELVRIGRMQFFILGLFLVCYIPVGPTFIKLFFGEEFELAYWSSLIVILPFLYVLCFSVSNSVLQALNMHRAKTLFLLFTSVFNVGLTIYFIPILGIVGASLATGISLIVGEVLLVGFYIKSRLDINIFYFYKQLFLSSVVVATYTSLWCIWGPVISSWSGVFLFSLIIAFGYFAIVYSFLLNAKEKVYLQNVFRTIVNRGRLS